MSPGPEKVPTIRLHRREEDIARSETLPTPPRSESSPSASSLGESGAPSLAALSSDDLLGRTIGDRYQVLELLGQGGMSRVFLARHELLEKIVAIKVLKDDLATSKAAMERFHREAKAAANIGDPHIVEVTDYGFTDGGQAFLVMERLEGQDLRALLRKEGALKPGRAVALILQLLRGLSAAHARGIIHRDLKAENIFITKLDGHEFVKILDFGISKLQATAGSDGQSITSTGAIVGTPQYIAPEQAHGKHDLDHRVDIYSIGVMLYEMLTGQLPFSGKTALEVMMKHVLEDPIPPRARRPELNIPPILEGVTLKAMSKDPDHRYRDTGQMIAALPSTELLSGGFSSLPLSSAGSAGALATDPARRGHRRWPLPLIAGFILGGALLFTWITLSTAPPESPLPATAVKIEKGSVIKSPGRSGAAVLTAAAEGDAAIPGTAGDPRSASGSSDAAPGSNDIGTPGAFDGAAQQVTLSITATPSTAVIFLNSVRVGLGACTVQVPRGGQVSLRAEAPDHQPLRRQLVADQDMPLSLTLQPMKRPGSAPEGDLQENPYR